MRSARKADADAMQCVAWAAYEPYVERIGRPPAPMTADYDALAGRSGVWIAELRGEVVGLLVLVLRDDHMLLDNVAVLPTVQGSGVGSRLLALAEDEARAHGRPAVRLFTNEAMTENVELYLRRGYRETGRRVQDGFRRVFFEKQLPEDRGGA